MTADLTGAPTCDDRHRVPRGADRRRRQRARPTSTAARARTTTSATPTRRTPRTRRRRTTGAAATAARARRKTRRRRLWRGSEGGRTLGFRRFSEPQCASCVRGRERDEFLTVRRSVNVQGAQQSVKVIVERSNRNSTSRSGDRCRSALVVSPTPRSPSRPSLTSWWLASTEPSSSFSRPAHGSRVLDLLARSPAASDGVPHPARLRAVVVVVAAQGGLGDPVKIMVTMS